jgi:HlyD family secretion protein
MASSKKKRRRKLLILGVIVVVLGAMAVSALMRKREPMVMVETEKIERRNLTEKVMSNGRIQPVLQVKISAEVSGEIIELPVREGQPVKKGDLLVRIKPDVYVAARQSSEASYLSSVSGLSLSQANLRKAQLEFERNEKLYRGNLIAESVYGEYKTALEIAQAQVESSTHQVAVAKAGLARAEEELSRTTIYSPLDGTVSQLNSELGERVVGTAMMTGTEIMTIADLNQMEARVDIGEIDIPLIQLGQKAVLEVDAFRDREFRGTVSEIANSARSAGAGGGQSQEGTKFEVRIRIEDREAFRPGMTVTCEVETRYRTNVVAVPIQSVTTRPPKKEEDEKTDSSATNAVEAAEGESDSTPTDTNATEVADGDVDKETKDEKDKKIDKDKPIEVVFIVEEDRAKMVPVKRGISDDDYSEIEEGLSEGQEVVKGSYRAIMKELEDGKMVTRQGKKPSADKKP